MVAHDGAAVQIGRQDLPHSVDAVILKLEVVAQLVVDDLSASLHLLDREVGRARDRRGCQSAAGRQVSVMLLQQLRPVVLQHRLQKGLLLGGARADVYERIGTLKGLCFLLCRYL